MNRTGWTSAAGFNAVCHRAGGRRRHNAARQRQAAQRLLPLARRLAEIGYLETALGQGKRKPLPRWFIPQMAGAFGVDRSTIWRDIRRRLRRWPWTFEYRGATDLVTFRLHRLGVVVYRLSTNEVTKYLTITQASCTPALWQDPEPRS
jgi:hypothetical protein